MSQKDFLAHYTEGVHCCFGHAGCVHQIPGGCGGVYCSYHKKVFGLDVAPQEAVNESDEMGARDTAFLLSRLREVSKSQRKALNAVKELHRPSKSGARCTHCSEDIDVPYPCATIQAIQKETK